ncbi:phosphotransferase [Sporosarcina sp. FSL W8-0480]|uniref:phosphotransferase enzyme family protein n=1 Tax=Sporosarcina sp. FSL W8-0480 TaxID=2954701 RepID=UPI0030D80CD9
MTQGEKEILVNRLKNLFDNDAVEIVPASDGYHNQVFIITTSKEKLVARLSLQTKRTKEELKSELKWIMTLCAVGIQVAKPKIVIGYDLIFELDTEENDYWVTFFEHTRGRPLDVMDHSEWNEEIFQEWGRQIACMHNVKTTGINRHVYLDSEERKKTIFAEAWLNRKHEQLINEMATWSRTPETFGLIHNDLHQGNFHLNENGIIFFDLDDCTYHFYSQDLAVSIYHALWTGKSFHPESGSFPYEFLTSFLMGYASKRRLNADMYKQLQVCLQMREVYLYSLFVLKWLPDDMMDWQAYKLEELKGNCIAGIIPYKEELEKVKYLFN